MNRIVNALLVLLMVMTAAAVYDMKYETEVAESAVGQLERQIRAEEEAISLLRAEYSVLTQPSRLQELAERHNTLFELAPLTTDQIATVGDIPERPNELVDASTAAALEDLMAEVAAEPPPAVVPVASTTPLLAAEELDDLDALVERIAATSAFQ